MNCAALRLRFQPYGSRTRSTTRPSQGLAVHVHAGGVAVVVWLLLRALPPPQLQRSGRTQNAKEIPNRVAWGTLGKDCCATKLIVAIIATTPCWSLPTRSLLKRCSSLISVNLSSGAELLRRLGLRLGILNNGPALQTTSCCAMTLEEAPAKLQQRNANAAAAWSTEIMHGSVILVPSLHTFTPRVPPPRLRRSTQTGTKHPVKVRS